MLLLLLCLLQCWNRGPPRASTKAPVLQGPSQSGSPIGPLSFSFSGLGEQRSKSVEAEQSQGMGPVRGVLPHAFACVCSAGGVVPLLLAPHISMRWCC